MQDCKVNILGADYLVTFDLDSDDADGEISLYRKTIQMHKTSEMLDRKSSDGEKFSRFKEVFRHELLHAILFESGAGEYAFDESLVNLLAIQFPKILKIFQELDIV